MKRIVTVDEIIKFLRDKNVRIVLTELFGGCKGLVRKQDDGYLVLIDQSLSFDAMLDALRHELCHILLGHLDSSKSNLQKENENMSGKSFEFAKSQDINLHAEEIADTYRLIAKEQADMNLYDEIKPPKVKLIKPPKVPELSMDDNKTAS